MKSLVILFGLLLLPMQAHAGIFEFVVTIAAAVFGGPAGWSFAAKFALGVALASYGEMQSRKVRKQTRAAAQAAREAYNNSLEERTITNVATDSPHVYVYGSARVGSSVVAILPSGTRDEYQHIIAIHAAHECDAIEEIYIGSKALGELDADGFAINSPDYSKPIVTFQDNITQSWTIDNRYIAGTITVYDIGYLHPEGDGGWYEKQVPFTQDGNSISVSSPSVGQSGFRTRYTYQYSSVRVKKHLGIPGEAADATLIAECPGKWTEASKLSGFCYTYIRLDLNQQEFQGGLPGIEARLRGKKILDPRVTNGLQVAGSHTATPYNITSFERSTTATYFDADGVLQTAGVDDPRFQDGKLLIEDESTNRIQNNTMQGASVGTRPTGWSALWTSTTNGVTASVVGVVEEDGIQCLLVRFNGTATAVSGGGFGFQSNTSVSSAVDDVWAFSIYCRLYEGSMGSATMRMLLQQRDASGVLLGNLIGPNINFSASRITDGRTTQVGTISQSSTAYIPAVIEPRWVNGATYDFKILIGLPQLEMGPVSSPIRTINAPVTRAADICYLTDTAFSDNNALVVYDYLTSEICGVPEEDIPLDSLMQAADDCDEVIDVDARYTFNGTVTSSEDKGQVLDRMAKSMAGGINSTTFEVWAGKWYEPTLALEQEDIVGAIAITPGESEADIVNGVTGQFISPENDYAPTDIKPYQNASYLAADGRDIFESLEFPYTNTTQRCHNLARIYVEDNRNSFTVQAAFSLKAWDTRIGQRITLNAPFFGFAAKVFRIVGKTYQPTGFVELLLKEDAAEIWDLADAVMVDSTPNTGLPNPFQIDKPASITLSSGTDELFRQADGTVVSRIKATWPASSSIYASKAEIQIKSVDASDWQTVANVDAILSVAYLSPVEDGQTYDTRIRFVNHNLSVTSPWTTGAPHTVIGKTEPPDAPDDVFVVGQQVYFLGNAGDPDLAGYLLRNIPGSVANWGAGQPLHDGFTTIIPFLLPVRLFGLQTIMVAAVDTSGNISDIASITHNFGQATLDNVVQSRDYQAEDFPGIQTDCTVDGGSLLADPDPTDSVYALANVYAQSDVYATNYLPMVWISDVFVPRYNGVVSLQLELAGNATIEYRYDGSTSNDLYALSNVYAESSLYQDRDVWQQWPGSLSVSRNQGLLFRISIAGGSTRGVIHAAEVFFTMNAVRQTFGTVDIDASGTRLDPMNGSPSYERWIQINTLQITPFNDGSGAAYGLVQDLNPDQGPAVLLANTSAVPVSGRATVDIGGIVDV